MGWGRFLFLGDLGQQFDLEDHRQELARVRRRLEETRTATTDWRRECQRLQRENDDLALYLTALIRLLASKNIVTPDEIRKLAQAIDEEDGVADGRITPERDRSAADRGKP